MARSDEYVLEALLTFDKLGVVVHELLAIEAWKEVSSSFDTMSAAACHLLWHWRPHLVARDRDGLCGERVFIASRVADLCDGVKGICGKDGPPHGCDRHSYRVRFCTCRELRATQMNGPGETTTSKSRMHQGEG